MSFNNLDENSPSIKQPKGLKIKLRPHQLTCVSAMRELEKQSNIIIDKPEIGSGIYHSIKYKIKDLADFTDSTFVLETNAAILADKPGSGKTYMVIALILSKIVPDFHDRFIVGTDHYSIKVLANNYSESANLIVVPHNLANQWGEFIDKSNLKYIKLNAVSDFDIFFDIDYVDKISATKTDNLVIYSVSRKKNIKLATATYAGSKTEKKVKKTKAKKIYERKTLNPKKIKNVLKNNSVVVLNVNRYKLFKQIFKSIKWSRVIIDEMDSANIPTIFDEYGNFNWFLTATPTSIFYKSCRRYVNKIFGHDKNLLEYFVVKNKDEYVDTSVVLPKPNVYLINTQLQKVVSAIQDLIPKDVMQLINAGNMKEAVNKLNCDVDTEENIVEVLTSKIKTELHNLEQELKYLNSIVPVDQDAHDKRIGKLKEDIVRSKTKLETISERIDSIKHECCFICADNFDTPTILDCCKSVFCFKCLMSSLNFGQNKCPYCRHVIKSNKEYHVIADKAKKKKKIVEKKSSKKGFGEMDKSDALETVISHIAKNDKTPRILIFSDYSQTFDKIIKNISKVGLQYAHLAGVPSHITNVINEFRAGTTNILMLDSQHYGSGLNLQDADYLILYHRMTQELETQVIGRAQRFGRKKSLKIIYLINDGESSVLKISNDPFRLENEDDLWMLSNPPEKDGDYEENNDTEEEQSDKKSPKKKKNKKENHKSDNTDVGSDVDDIDNVDDSDTNEIDTGSNKKAKSKRKNKKMIEV